MDKLWKQLAEEYSKIHIEYPGLKTITLAQWILEAGIEPSPLAVKHYNFGGLKWRSEMEGFAEKVEYIAHDGTEFYCKFDSPASFIKGYWKFIDRSPYKGWRNYTETPEDYIGFIGKIYCPSNSHYAEDVIGLKEKAESLLAGYVSGDKNLRVALEVGHGPDPDLPPGKVDPGAVGAGTTEYAENLFRAKLIAGILEEKGIDTAVIDDRKNLIELSKMAKGFDVFVSLHLNAFDGKVQGTETYIHKDCGADDKKLAEAIQKALCRDLKLTDRGVKICGFSVLVGSTPVSAACLSEAFFIDSVKTPEKIREMSKISAESIARGILNYLGIP